MGQYCTGTHIKHWPEWEARRECLYLSHHWADIHLKMSNSSTFPSFCFDPWGIWTMNETTHLSKQEILYRVGGLWVSNGAFNSTRCLVNPFVSSRQLQHICVKRLEEDTSFTRLTPSTDSCLSHNLTSATNTRPSHNDLAEVSNLPR